MFASFTPRRNPTADGEPCQSFASDDRGSVAILFAFIIFALCLFVGGAVDFARWAQARHQTIAAMDAAVLAGGRMLQLNESVETAREVALKYYVENTKDRAPVIDDTITFDATDDNTAFAAMGNAYIETSFLSLAHIKKLPLLDVSKAEFSKADLDRGGKFDQPVEISMMLDITGSMSGTKIRDLKAAAADLVNIVISDSPLANPVRIALAPFADAVRLPASSIGKAVGSPSKIVKKTSGSGNNQRTNLYNRSENCVVERAGNDRYTDAGPGSGRYVMPFRAEVAAIPTSQGTVLIDGKSNTTEGAKATVQWKSSSTPSKNQKTSLENAANNFASCPIPASGELVPLTKNKATLINRIENLPANGMTAGQIGTAWAWYMLSPNWNSLWDSSSAASAYDGDAQKIAILMTDGEYNRQYDANGIVASSSSAAANGDSTTQARSLCTAMKAKGITVYTVGFALGKNSTASKTLDHCATDPTMAYTADTGAQLREAFRDIALKISKLHLTQ